MSFERAQAQYDAQEPPEASDAEWIHEIRDALKDARELVEIAAGKMAEISEKCSIQIWHIYDLFDDVSFPQCCKECQE